jgi:hypothetical protein
MLRRSNPGGNEIFRTCPDRPWGPPSLLYNGYRVFPGVKNGRGVTLTPHTLLVPWSWKGRAIPLLPLWAVRPVQSLSACTRVHFNLPQCLYKCEVYFFYLHNLVCITSNSVGLTPAKSDTFLVQQLKIEGHYHDACLSTDTDWGVCSWPCKMFVLGKANISLSVNSNRCIPVKNTIGWTSVVFCACDIIQLFSIVFCIVSAVNEIDLRRVTNETPDK